MRLYDSFLQAMVYFSSLFVKFDIAGIPADRLAFSQRRHKIIRRIGITMMSLNRRIGDTVTTRNRPLQKSHEIIDVATESR